MSLTNNFRNLLNSQIKCLRYGSDTHAYAQPRQTGYFGVYFSAGIKGTF